MLLGFFIAGLLHSFIPSTKIKKLLSARGFGSIIKASAVGIPLPLCSCSVIPVGVSLRKAGASKGATASFFVSTPEIGVDSFLLSYGLMGPVMAVARALAAFFSAMTVGLLIDRFAEDTDVAAAPTQKPTGLSVLACCTSESESTPQSEPDPSPSLLSKVLAALHYGFNDLLNDIAVLLFVGICLSGLITVLVPADALNFAGAGRILSMLLMLIAALPLYVCASSSTPIAAALVAKGLDPGAAIIFLLAGPASNVATMLVIRRELGNRALMLYLSGISVVSLIFGIGFSATTSAFGWESVFSEVMHHHAGTISTVSAAILLVLMIRSVASEIAKRFGPSDSPSCCH